jgi:hypothetical protein
MSNRGRLFLLLFLGPPVLLSVAILLMVISLPAPVPERLGSGRNLLAAVTTGVLALAWLVLLAWTAIRAFRSAGRAFEGIFVDMGLISRPHLLFGRRYTGQLKGWQIEAEFVPARTNWPSLLSITVPGSIGAEMVLAPKAPVGALNLRPVPADPADLGGCGAFAPDPGDARTLLDTVSATVFSRLLSRQKEDGLRELHVRPNGLSLRSHPTGQVTSERIRQWVEDLLNVAEAWSSPSRSA